MTELTCRLMDCKDGGCLLLLLLSQGVDGSLMLLLLLKQMLMQKLLYLSAIVQWTRWLGLWGQDRELKVAQQHLRNAS
jgi:hypothetical protein